MPGAVKVPRPMRTWRCGCSRSGARRWPVCRKRRCVMARKATVSRRDPLSGFFPPQPAAAPEQLAGTLSLALDQVLPDPEQPRKDWAYAEGARLLEELVAS